MTGFGHHQPLNVDATKQSLDAALDPKLTSPARLDIQGAAAGRSTRDRPTGHQHEHRLTTANRLQSPGSETTHHAPRPSPALARTMDELGA